MKNPTKSQALKHSINELTIGWSKMACCRHTVSEGIRSFIPTKKKWSAARHPHVAFAWQNNTLVEKVDWCKLTSACSLKNCHCCTHFYFFQISFNRKIWIFQTGRRRMSDASSNESKSSLWKRNKIFPPVYWHLGTRWGTCSNESLSPDQIIGGFYSKIGGPHRARFNERPANYRVITLNWIEWKLTEFILNCWPLSTKLKNAQITDIKFDYGAILIEA